MRINVDDNYIVVGTRQLESREQDRGTLVSA